MEVILLILINLMIIWNKKYSVLRIIHAHFQSLLLFKFASSVRPSVCTHENSRTAGRIVTKFEAGDFNEELSLFNFHLDHAILTMTFHEDYVHFSTNLDPNSQNTYKSENFFEQNL
jgi:hypothetical protein